MNILIVDDEPRHRRGMMNLILSLRPGDRVEAAGDGQAALDMIRSGRPDLVLTDIRMPNMDGLEFLRQLESESRPPKVVMVSAYNLFDYAQQALRHGASDYLLKPVDDGKLEAMLNRIEEGLKLEDKRRAESEELEQRLERMRFAAAGESGPAPDGVSPISAGGESESASASELQARPEVSASEPPAADGDAAAQARECLDWIEEHLREELTLERAAERFFFNPSYFSTWIKQQTGRTFTQHLTEARMRRARELLGENKRIYEAAAACGYPDTKYFCRVFKKRHGVSPAVYKHRSARKKAAE
ncbi:response regulator [Saccharibacillus sp. CPCC 101409]|uniref:response regulator n=1 Tax=Saccharibacillus sp. CPCC 101409 TaxID=3058041 RepID=UPI00267135BE|nr:response regulator [Saccharibacillus sp. CPCC 101409]MDO3409265.1 response regulator [Saccharibacillus sp. CPCC 101409]